MPWISNGRGGQMYTGSVGDTQGYTYRRPITPRPPLTPKGRVFVGILLLVAIFGVGIEVRNGSAAREAVEAADRSRNPPLRILDHPIANLECTGDYILVTAVVVGPNAAAEVATELRAQPESSYLRVEQSCKSTFRGVGGLSEAYSNYMIYLGPYDTVAEVKDACAKQIGTSYAMKLGPSLGNGQPCHS